MSESSPPFDLTIMLGHWPFRRLRHAGPQGVRQLMARTGTSKALAVPLQAAFYKNPAEAADEMLEGLDGAQDLLPCASVSPLFPGWERDLERLVGTGGCVACALFPGYQSYALHHPLAEALLSRLQAMELPALVFVRLQDERSHPPRMQVPPVPMDEVDYLLRAYPRLPVAICNANLPLEAPALRGSLDRPAVTLLTTSYKSLKLADMVALLGAEHLAYASCAPLFYPESALLQVAAASISDQERAMILRGNAESFLGWEAGR